MSSSPDTDTVIALPVTPVVIAKSSPRTSEPIKSRTLPTVTAPQPRVRLGVLSARARSAAGDAGAAGACGVREPGPPGDGVARRPDGLRLRSRRGPPDRGR